MNNFVFQIKDVTDFCNTVQMEYEAALRKYQTLKSRKTRLDKETQELSTQENTLTQQLENWTEEYKTNKKQNAELNREESDLQKTFYALKERCLEAEIRLEVAERSTQLLEQEVARLEVELEEIETSKDKTDSDLNNFLDMVNTE